MINKQQVKDKVSYIDIPPDKMRNHVFAVIDRGQLDPAVQIRATALALYALCDAVDVDIRSLLVSIEQQIGDLNSPYTPTLKAIREYARNEIGVS